MKAVDPGEYLQTLYPVEKTLFKKEAAGFTFAVHEMRKCQGGVVFAVCSTRLTDSTKAALRDNIDYMSYLGGVTLVTPKPFLEEGGYQFIPLIVARLKQADIQIDWVALIPNGKMPEQISNCELKALVSASNEAEQALRNSGKPSSVTVDANVPIPDNEPLKIEEVVNKVFADGILLEPIVHSFLVTNLKEKPPHAHIWKKLRDTSPDQVIRTISTSPVLFHGN